MANANVNVCSTPVMRLWCLGLLVMAGLRAAEAQVGAYSTDVTSVGAYSLFESAIGAYGLQESAIGAYGLSESAGSYGQGALGYAFEHELAVVPAYGMRRLLANGLGAPADTAPVKQHLNSPENVDNEFDIIPQDLPSTRSWDSRTAQSWEEWYSEHFGSSTTTSPAYGAALGGYGDNAQYGYAMGSYGVSAYFDFRSNKAYIPAVIQDKVQPISEQAPAPIAAANAGGLTPLNIEHVNPGSDPTVAGVSRGRGTAVQQLSESAQAVQLALMEPAVSPVMPAGRLGRALRGFSRKLHLSREAAEEVMWAFRQ